MASITAGSLERRYQSLALQLLLRPVDAAGHIDGQHQFDIDRLAQLRTAMGRATRAAIAALRQIIILNSPPAA